MNSHGAIEASSSKPTSEFDRPVRAIRATKILAQAAMKKIAPVVAMVSRSSGMMSVILIRPRAMPSTVAKRSEIAAASVAVKMPP